MREEKIMQFVSFETTLDSEEFIMHWDEYTRSVNSNLDVMLQQSEKKGFFRYLAQHRCAVGEFKFVFAKGKRSSRNPEVEIKARQLGGYSVLQSEKTHNAASDESKVFAFIMNHPANLDVFKTMGVAAKLNIYEPYYENCHYAIILEYFVKNKYLAELTDQLKATHIDDFAVYKECALQIL
ncbi:MAG: hypothetical protein WBC06_11730 [Chitinophagaceae bacterium]